MSEEQALSCILERRNIPGAFKVLVEIYADRLVRFMTKVCGNEEDAEDLTQETLLAAYRHIKRFNPKRAGFFTWLCAIGEKQWLMLCRKRRRQQACYERLAKTCDPTVPGPELEHRDRLDREWVWSVLGKCTFEEQMVAVLHGMEGRTIAETAKILGMPESATRYHWHQMLVKVRILLRVVGPYGGPR
jgi:RNA polymerase sigma-70 factor (ECF subfamily)